jgi:hypothetical protein
MSDASNQAEYQIQLTPLALEMLAAVNDRREQEKLRDRIDHRSPLNLHHCHNKLRFSR